MNTTEDKTPNKPWAFEKKGSDWENFFAGLGQPLYRAAQVCAWLWKRGVFDPAMMTDFSLPMRAELESLLDFTPPLIVKEERAGDGTGNS